MSDDIETLRRKLRQLKEQHDSGALDAARYAESRAPLERRLVDAVTSDAAAASPPIAPRPSRKLLAGLSASVLIVAFAGYGWTGSPKLINGVPTAPAENAAQPQEPTPAQVTAMVDKLAQRLKDRPDDAQGWSMLARAYAMLGRTAEAMPAYERAVALRADDAGLLADYADAMAVQNGRQLNGKPLELVAKALKIEPGNLKALALAGTAAFDRKDYAGAVQFWDKLMQGVPTDSPYHAQVQAGIDEARQLGKLPPSTTAPSASTNPAPTAATAATKARLITDTNQNRLIVAAPIPGQLEQIEQLINRVDKPVHGQPNASTVPVRSQSVQITKVFRPRSAESTNLAQILTQALTRRSAG